MVVRVRQAMIVPHYGQGGANGCMVASHLQSSRDLSLQPAAMEKRLTGGVENGRQGAQEALVPWQRAASGSSISSIDSLPAGDSAFSTSDMSSSLFQQKARLGLHAAESDEELMPDSMQEDLLIKKLRRHYGSAVQPHPAALLYADEGDPVVSFPNGREFEYFSGELHFNAPVSPKWLASARNLSSGLDDLSESIGSEDTFPRRSRALSNLAGGLSSLKAPFAAESLPLFTSQLESHSGSRDVGLGSVAADQGSTPSDDGKDPSLRVKFMCSFGGKIFPRPSDGKLRYVGGDTKIIAVNRDLNFLELMAKMTEVYGEALTLKYQLPDEDLDALVSVSSDEDLENMMEEYDKLDADGSSRLRVFLFPAVDYDFASHHNDSSGDLRNSEQRYVDAVNGISEVGSRNRGESYVGSAQSYSIDNLLCIDAPETWSMPRGQDALPVAMVAPQGAHDVASHILRVPVTVPVSTVSTRPNVPSAPPSAPSSPPLLPRQALGKLVSDIHLQYHQDKHVKLGAQYNVLVAEGNYLENENLAGSGLPPVGGQQEPLYRSSDKQHDGGHQDHSLRAEQRRLPETKIPRVGSHGKLSRLAEHAELSSATNESQQLPDVLEMQRLLQQQQQQSLHQTVWQHPMESHQESYRRPDLLQSTIAQNAVLGQQQGYQQHQPGAFRAGLAQGLPSHETGYRQDQQLQYAEDVLHHISRSVSSHTVVSGVPSAQSSSYHVGSAPSGVPSAQSTSYHVGSAPSSPRLGFREVPSRHAPGPQQVPLHGAFGGAAFAEQQPSYGRRMNYGDQSGRSFRVSNSPPKYRDHLVHSDERLLRQQQQALGNPEALHLEQIPKVLYENNPAVQPYDLLSRPQLPLYKGMNPFQEKPIAYQDHQEIGDTRRHQLPQQGKESQFLPGQQHMHSLHHNQRLDYHDPLLQQSEQLPGNPRYQDTQLKVPEWDTDEARLGFRVRGRSGQLDDELHADSALSHHRDLQQTGYPGLHLPETSDDLLSGSVADFTPVHSKGDRLDHPGNTGFQFRQGMLPPSAFGSHSGPKPRTNLSDSANMARYMTRSNEPDFLATGGLRAGGNVQDPRSSIFDSNGHQHTSSVVGQGLQFGSSFHRLEERPAPTAFNPIAQPLQNLRLGDNTMIGNDMRWNGGLGADDVRIEVPNLGRDLIGSFYDDRLPGLPSLAMSRGSRLSRPPSSTNIPNLLEEDRGGVAHLQTYGTQCRSNSLMDEDALNQYAGQNFRGTENLLFNSNSSRHAVPPSQVDTVPATSTGLYAFDPTPANSTSSDYHILVSATDLPNIKTTATQVPSVEGDESSGSAHTTGGSYHSMSNQGSVEMLLGQLTMTQHLAEDVASCVLEPSPLKVASQEHVQKESDVVEDRSGWAIDTAPTFSPNLWENALDDAMLTNFKDGNNDENLEEEDDSVPEETETKASINKDEASEEVLVVGTSELEREGSIVKHSVEVEEEGDIAKSDVAAATAEAIAHGLQTIKNADLEELRELGSGTFGTVYHGKWRGTDVAIKRIKSSCFAGRLSEQDRLIADFWREACNLGHLHHPNVVAFYGVVADGPGGTLATVTEYMVNGSLKQVLQKKDRTIDRRKRLLIAMDSAFGMEYLHGKNIVHFDLKCENLLVNMRDPHRPICKVGDLGLSKVKHQTMVSGGVRGTLPWMAPELLNGSSSLVTEKVDVFSFGIVMWELLTGEEPYANMHYGAIIGGIVNNTLRPPIPTWCDPAWRTLMERCWSADTASRPSFSEVASELRAMSEGLKPKSQPQSQGQSPPLIQA